MNIEEQSFDELKRYYDCILNKDKSTYKTSNDEPTPIECIMEMAEKIPIELWKRDKLRILDPCCGNGNFGLVLYHILLSFHSKTKILEEILDFNDINEDRLTNVQSVFCNPLFKLRISNHDFLAFENEERYDLIVANPPYARILPDGKRASKNHNLIKSFIQKALQCLKPNGYLMFLTPDNWMSFADRNSLIHVLTELQIIHLNIHGAKKYFKKIGSSFTWYVIQNTPFYQDIQVSGVWKKKTYESFVPSKPRKYIPLFYNHIVFTILEKTIENIRIPKFKVETSSDLHKYTKATEIQTVQDDIFCYRLIHTPKQTVFSRRPHKYQEGYKVFISTTDKYNVFIDSCGMTQSIVFIRCRDKEQAEHYCRILQHPLFVFLNNICRWGNFNNIRILQQFPNPDCNPDDIYSFFNITPQEQCFILDNL